MKKSLRNIYDLNAMFLDPKFYFILVDFKFWRDSLIGRTLES